MDNKNFDELLESVRQGGEILQGKCEPSRITAIVPYPSQGPPFHCAMCQCNVGIHDPGGVVMGINPLTKEIETLRYCWDCWPL